MISNKFMNNINQRALEDSPTIDQNIMNLTRSF